MMKNLIVAAVATLVALGAQAQPLAAYVAGQHYQELPVPVRVADPERQEVIEVFSYACIHCYQFTPTIEEWKEDLPDDVNFVRLPAVFDQEGAHLARAYYTAEVLGVVDRVHTPIFDAVHVRNANVLDPGLMARIFQEHADIAEQEFLRVFNSVGVDTRVRQADAQGRMFRITGTPTVVVNGRYRIDGRMAGSNPGMLDVADFLLARERANAAAREEAE